MHLKLDQQTDRRDCACGIKMESDLDVDDPSNHENEQRAETWVLKITLRLDDGKDFSDFLPWHTLASSS